MRIEHHEHPRVSQIERSSTLEGLTRADYEALRRAGYVIEGNRRYFITELEYLEMSTGLLDVLWFGREVEE